MSCSKTAAGLSLLLLAGCAPAPAKSAGSPAPKILTRSSTWRILSLDPPGGKAAPRPLGYVEARRLEAEGGLGGTVYIVYDRDDRPLGHVTERGRGVRYAAGAEGPSETLGPASVPALLARLLGTPGPLRVYDPQGRPAGLP